MAKLSMKKHQFRTFLSLMSPSSFYIDAETFIVCFYCRLVAFYVMSSLIFLSISISRLTLSFGHFYIWKIFSFIIAYFFTYATVWFAPQNLFRGFDYSPPMIFEQSTERCEVIQLIHSFNWLLPTWLTKC